MSQIILEPRDSAWSMTHCGAGSQMLAGAFVGTIVGFIVAIVIGRDEKAGAAAGALAGMILLPLFGC